ncbi:MAG: low molecular weight protein-tyrosine-phosphatase [Sinobacterium sp.]
MGNICRSPTAERMLKQNMPNKNITSAGINALVGYDIDPEAASLLEANGYDASQHIARNLDRKMIVEADLVLVMEKEQQALLTKHYPEASGKIMMFGKWQNEADINDPYRKSSECFYYVFEKIEKNTTIWCKKLMD